MKIAFIIKCPYARNVTQIFVIIHIYIHLPEYDPELKLPWLETEVERLRYRFLDPPPTILVLTITSPE